VSDENVNKDLHREVEKIQRNYPSNASKCPISTVVNMCLYDDNKEAFIRHFMLVVLATIIDHVTSNCVDLKYLKFLMCPILFSCMIELSFPLIALVCQLQNLKNMFTQLANMKRVVIGIVPVLLYFWYESTTIFLNSYRYYVCSILSSDNFLFKCYLHGFS
jgi:hypothetical protein